MTNRQRLLEIGALTAATAAVGWMLHSVPSWGDANAAPSLLATLAAAGTVAFFWVRLWQRPRSAVAKVAVAKVPAVKVLAVKVLKLGGAQGDKTYRATRAERFVLAAFLAGMPVVYFAQCFYPGSPAPGLPDSAAFAESGMAVIPPLDCWGGVPRRAWKRPARRMALAGTGGHSHLCNSRSAWLENLALVSCNRYCCSRTWLGLVALPQLTLYSGLVFNRLPACRYHDWRIRRRTFFPDS